MSMPRAGEGIWLGREFGCGCFGKRWRREDVPRTGGNSGQGSSLPSPWISCLSLSAFPSAGCWHSPELPKTTSWDEDAAGRKPEVGDGSGRYLRAGLALWGCPVLLTGSIPPVPQFPHRLHRGRDLAWLPAWPPRFEFLLCACPAARKVLWESKYSSPRRLQPGCSHRRRGAPGEGLCRCRGTGEGLLPLPPVPTVLGGGSPRAAVAAPPTPKTSGCSASFHLHTPPCGQGRPPGSGGTPPVQRGPLSSGRGPGVFCRAAGLACGGEGRCDEHSSHI